MILAPDGTDAWARGKVADGREADSRFGAGASVETDAGGGGGIARRAEIAEAEGVTRSFVNRLLRLTLLAPDIVEAILEGRQPKEIQLEELSAGNAERVGGTAADYSPRVKYARVK